MDENQHKLQDGVYNSGFLSHRADTQKLLVIKEEDPSEQQESGLSLDQENSPEPPRIKEEQEEVWSSQEGEQLQRQEEAEIIKFTFSPVFVKSEDDGDGEELQFSQLCKNQNDEGGDKEHLKTEADLEDCGGSEPVINFNPLYHLQPVTDEEISHSESETDNSCDWEEASEPQSGLNPLQNEEHATDEDYGPGNTSVSASEYASSSGRKEHLQKHKRIQTEEKVFSCSVCGKTFGSKSNLSAHEIRHTTEQGFSCSVCKKSFPKRVELARHMRMHTGEKPFRCSVCGGSFTQKSSLYTHHQVHTGEKPFSCSFCGRNFAQKSHLSRHLKVHTGEKPFSCSECTAVFLNKNDLVVHMRTHTGEKPFMCSVCGKRFTRSVTLKHHLMVHRGEKPFSCSVCDKRFTLRSGLIRHKCKGIVLS